MKVNYIRPGLFVQASQTSEYVSKCQIGPKNILSRKTRRGQTGRVPGYSQVLPDILAVSPTLRAEFGTPLKLIKEIQIENKTLQRF